MSRIGNAPVTVPKSVQVNLQGNTFSAKGPQGALSFTIPATVTPLLEGNRLVFKRASDSNRDRAMHGTVRARIANIIRGCAEGFKKELQIVGVGYRAAVKGQAVDLTLGFSHPVQYQLPEGVKAEVTKEGLLILTSADKALVGQVAADIRDYRLPEPYKGKGIKYVDETILRKEGKRGKGGKK